MTRETYDQAKELFELIAYHERVIGAIDQMLERFDDRDHVRIDVAIRTSRLDNGQTIPHYELPELREALQKARERFEQTLKEDKAKLEAL